MITQRNKKILSMIILSSVLVIAALGAFFLKKYCPGDRINFNSSEESSLNITCDFRNKKEITQTAQKNDQPELCTCLKNQQERENCIKSVVDISLYNQAIKSLNLSLCNEIYSKNIKDACRAVVASQPNQTNEK